MVWEVLTDWERQSDWMLDALSVEVLTPTRTGEGVTIRCPTRLLGVVVQDVMRVTDWRPERRLEVVHLGSVITGSGAFDLEPVDGGRRTRIRWTEWIDPPLGAFGEWGAGVVAAPLLRRLFGRSLDNLVEIAETA